jgi:hypothetical protein
MDLKCAPCTDRLIADGGSDTDLLPPAVTIVTVLQTFAANGQQIAGPVMMPVCIACRQKQIGTVSKTGLVTV